MMSMIRAGPSYRRSYNKASDTIWTSTNGKWSIRMGVTHPVNSSDPGDIFATVVVDGPKGDFVIGITGREKIENFGRFDPPKYVMDSVTSILNSVLSATKDRIAVHGADMDVLAETLTEFLWYTDFEFPKRYGRDRNAAKEDMRLWITSPGGASKALALVESKDASWEPYLARLKTRSVDMLSSVVSRSGGLMS